MVLLLLLLLLEVRERLSQEIVKDVVWHGGHKKNDTKNCCGAFVEIIGFSQLIYCYSSERPCQKEIENWGFSMEEIKFNSHHINLIRKFQLRF